MVKFLYIYARKNLTESKHKVKLPKSKLIYVDIDRTICSQHDHPDFDDQPVDYSGVEPIPERIKQINELFDKGHTIVYWTARGTVTGLDQTKLTRNQLKHWGAKYTDVKLGKPNYDLFICDKAMNSQAFFEKEAS